MQQRLKSPPGSARAEVVAAEFLKQFLVPAHHAITAFTWDSEGKPFRRLLLTSKALEVEVLVFDSHDAPPDKSRDQERADCSRER